MKQRVLESDEVEGQDVASGSSGPRQVEERQRGLRRRILEQSSKPEDVPEAPPHGVRRRIEKAEKQEGAAQAHATDDVPFNTSMRRDWCEGKLTSNQVLEYAWGATQQGMGGGRETGEEKYAEKIVS